MMGAGRIIVLIIGGIKAWRTYTSVPEWWPDVRGYRRSLHFTSHFCAFPRVLWILWGRVRGPSQITPTFAQLTG